MTSNQIVEIETGYSFASIRNFIDAMIDQDLYINSQTLEKIYPSREDLAMAISRAMRICVNTGLPIREHFRSVYISDHHQHYVKRNWKMSEVACCLVLVNGNPENPLVGRLQLALLKRM